MFWSDNGTNFVETEKSFFCASTVGTQKLHCRSYTKALSGSVFRQVYHIKVDHGSEWCAVVSACFMQS